MKQGNTISVILPTLNFIESTKEVLDALTQQTLQLDELIIIDSSETPVIFDLSNHYKTRLNISYLKVSNKYPGEARNIGINNAKSNYVAILDSKTIPNKDWLSNAFNKLISNNLDAVFGSTVYIAETSFQSVLQACIYGIKPVVTTPGTIISKKSFNEIGLFIEGVRASDDLEWRNRVRGSKLNTDSLMGGELSYTEISKNFASELKRNFIYQFHSALTEVQMNTKIFIMGLSLLLISLVIPHWNAIVGSKDSILYVPYITRGFFYIVSIISIILLTSSKFIKFRTSASKILAAFFTLFLLYFSSQWNEVMADWVDESFLYIPHITKFYILTLAFLGIIYRGIYVPIRGGIFLRTIFPFNWIIFGITGFLLDLAKAPGYFVGAGIALLKTFRS
jgi:glycosyltransferase involved in cell wall biosynthesis